MRRFDSRSVTALRPTLRDLAARLTPNPARTVDGTLQVILDGIDRIDENDLARTIGHVSARLAGLDAPLLTPEEWEEASESAKLQLLLNAQIMKIALRQMIGDQTKRELHNERLH